MNNLKKKEIVNLLVYILLPMIMIAIYPMFHSYVFKGGTSSGSVIIYGLWIINALCICYVSHIQVKTYKNVVLVITIIYAIVFGCMYLRYLFPAISILTPITNLMTWSEDIVHIWFACYLYCLIKIIYNNVIANKYN